MHDIVNLENRGIPAMFVASVEFIEAAKAQSTALGFEPVAEFVPHPIQGRTDEEMRAMANEVFESILNKIRA